MTTIEEMDEFVNWDKAGDSVGNSLTNPSSLNTSHPTATATDTDMPTDPDLDLVLANVDDDDFSFWALEHFNGQEAQAHAQGPGVLSDALQADAAFEPIPIPTEDQLSELYWYTPDKPCTNCSMAGFSCKKIKEGQFKDYCTSCVALRCECSFAPALSLTSHNGNGNDTNNYSDPALEASSSMLPENQWPTLAEYSTAPPLALGGLDPIGLLGASLSAAPQPSALPTAPLAAPSESIAALGGPGLNKNSPPPKIGARFSRESVKILKNWLLSHNRHPYPSDEEKEMLQRQTGLNKTQITNWLANARRRGKVQAPRSTSPHVRSSYAGPIDIPRRPGTPAQGGMRNMNPLERWVDSPPENEPASVTAIARAVASNSDLSSGLNSPYSFAFTDDGSGRSQGNGSSASSIGTSSGGSFASAYSHASNGSFGSFGSINNRGRRRRRRRAAPKRADEKTSLTAPLKTFQCTFCTETFRTKHDWQRHEKSLHLSLERWVCAPDGPRVLHPQLNTVCCTYCGDPDPDDAHIDSHNHSTCQERPLDERTFYRKDHLNQHLRLVHNVKFLDWGMKTWKVASPEIRSRCGFCGIVMDSWSIRVDHLAEHFKTGNTMADWRGDWGFEAPVLEMVENSIPPYLIDNERNSPFPFVGGGAPPESPRSAYELIKIELAYFMTNLQDRTGSLPSDFEMQLEACRIIFASEVLSLQGIDSNFSWLRDLLMSSSEVSRQAQFGPLRTAIESRLSILKINGKDNLFEQCPLEQHLHEYVRTRRLLGLTAMDDELQLEACRIVGRIEEISTSPSDFIANWLVRLIRTSTHWLANFRQRAHLPRTEDIECTYKRSTDATTIDSTIYNFSRLETSLREYMDSQLALGKEPTDEDLQREARITIYEFDDGWNQTAADNPDWLRAFRERHSRGSPGPAGGAGIPTATNVATNPKAVAGCWFDQGEASASSQSQVEVDHRCVLSLNDTTQGNTFTTISEEAVANLVNNGFRTGQFFFNDANCYRRLARELHRFVAATMSSNNPNCHVPTDEELQHQARWILYDEDDPWNQTAADNAEWLQRFKRDAGIISSDGPGLPRGKQWSLGQGGSGFAPPYAFPNAAQPHSQTQTSPGTGPATTLTTSTPSLTTGATAPATTAGYSPGSSNGSNGAGGRGAVTVREGRKPFEMDQASLNQYLETFTSRYPRPATIFCSRELEAGLVDFVRSEIASGYGFPDDAALRAQGRSLLKSATTAADDDTLLAKFKEWVAGQLSVASGEQQGQGEASSAELKDSKMTMSDEEMDNILANMSSEVDAEWGALDLSMGMGRPCNKF